MKKVFTIISILFSVSLFAQNGDGVLSALKEGNAAKFGNFFSSKVDVKFPQKTELKGLSREDASSAVSSFFSSNNISGFDVTSQREMDGTMYIAGKLKNNAQGYNLTVMLKNGSVITVRIS
ncbi:MAG: DUF4783 domain-containing protein [Parafilimonas sp.]|nr:DUF4783 domain-containing protein [Parafilimonas sp.]